MGGGRGGVASKYWFEDEFGFPEGSYEATRKKFTWADGILTSKTSGKSYHVGPFEALSTEEIRERVVSASPGLDASLGGLVFKNIVGDARALHRDKANTGAVFQVASQFNCLEMNEPGARPEDGITRYAWDATQGPACALSCPAGTLFRNYFVGGHGQGHGHQIDCLGGVGEAVKNGKEKYWRMLNGYCMPTAQGSIARLSHRLMQDPALVDVVRDKMQVGVHWETEVAGGKQRVCQVFCSALPVAYAKFEKADHWRPFATAVLDACFETTLAAAVLLAAQRGERVKVFLTAVGGGAFGNRSLWIVAALQRALALHTQSPLDVMLVHFATIPKGLFKGLETSRGRASPEIVVPPPPEPEEHTPPGIPPPPEGGLRRERSKGEQLTAIFSRLDLNGDGVIAKEELKAVLAKLDDQVFNEESVDNIFEAADANADGEIHYAEFVAWLCNEDPAVLARVVSLGGWQPNTEFNDAALWPLDKLQARLQAWEGPAPPKGFAVLLCTGAMNPPHAGHLQLLRQARVRLQKADYCVLAAFLSPSHDGYVQPKAKDLGTVGLSAPLRLEVARQVVAGDELVEVGSWEARQPGQWPDYPEVARSLQEALGRLPEASRLCGAGGLATVFYACGTDHAQKCDLYSGLRPERQVGVVVVPRAGERPQSEKPEALVFVAEPAHGQLASLSSTKVRQAIRSRDKEYLGSALSAPAVDFLLRPTAEQYASFPEDFAKLGVSQPDS